MVESTSETSHSAVNNSNNGRTMLCRSEIDNHGAEISPLCHFSAGAPQCPYRCFLAKVVPFDEIVANPSDLKHVGKLMGRSDGLGVVIMVGSHHLCVFYSA